MPVRERFGRKQFHYDLRRAKTGLGVASTGGGGGAHNFLGAVVHNDTETAAPSEGALVLANATPKWDLLAHPHAAGYAMVTDATTWLIDQTPTWTGRHSWSDGAVQAYVDEDGSADFNGHVAIGANAGVNLARTLNILETSVNTTLSYTGVFTILAKTAGASDEDDSFTGHYVLAEMNQSGGTISYLYGVSAWARITDGQVGTSGAARYLRGLYGVADIDGGIVYDHAIGVHALADHESGAMVDGNLVGVYSQVDNDGTVNGSAILLWLDALTGVDYALYLADDVPSVHRGAATFGATNLPAAQVDIDQSAAAGAIPALMLDQGDVSEQCILFSSDSTDRDINLWTVDVTGTPKATWDESEDDLDWNKNLILSAGDLKLASALGIIHADGVVDGQVLVADGTRYVPGDMSDITGGDAEFVVMALSATLANERVLVGGDSLTLTDGGAGGNATLDLDAPGTLTVATGNAAAAPHTHAITSSSNPGAAAAILASAADGGIQLLRLGIGADGNADNLIRMADDAAIGLSGATGRIVFDSTGVDAIEITVADLEIASSGYGIIHADGVAAGYALIGNGTRYVPAALNANVPIAPGARGHIIRAEAGPVWASYNAATLGAVLIGDGTDIISDTTPTFVNTVTLDDGVSHSPILRFIGGTNDDTASLRLIEDVVAGNSDFGITLVADDADARLLIRNTSGVTHAWIDAVGAAAFDSHVDIDGHASIGSEAIYQAHQVLNIDEISTSTAVQNVYGAGILLQAEPGANTQTSFQGIHSLVRLDTAQAQTAGQFAGVTGRAEINGGIAGTVLDGMGGSFYVDAEDGTMTTASGAQIWTPHVDNGGVTTGRGAWIRAGVVGGGSVTTLYGLYIDDIAAGGTNWSIYTNGGAHYLGAYTKITQAAAAGAIEVLALQQDDIDKSFVNYLGTSAADQTRSISTVNGDGAVEGPKNFASSAGWAFQGMVRIEINSVEYWMPYYSADTS